MPASGPPPNRTLVFIHGGSFDTGSTGVIYGGHWGWVPRGLVRERGIIVATLSYRLGAFGWLARAGGNLGLRDQAVGLRFLRQLLGPAATRLLVFGQSAGAVSVMAHLATPATTTDPPLFDAAAIVSGTPGATPVYFAEAEADVWLRLTPCAQSGGLHGTVVSSPLSRAGASKGGRSWGPLTLACLRNLSVEEVLTAQVSRLFDAQQPVLDRTSRCRSHTCSYLA